MATFFIEDFIFFQELVSLAFLGGFYIVFVVFCFQDLRFFYLIRNSCDEKTLRNFLLKLKIRFSVVKQIENTILIYKKENKKLLFGFWIL